MILSIDQNCHPLWDTIPKLQALARRGRRPTHLIEDIDVAFTDLGAVVGDRGMSLARERYHHSGGSYWGAALFYSEFMGRLPVDVRDWDAFTGLKTGTLAKKLGRGIEDLYDEFSPGDNWQLIGSSYVGDRERHRVIGDLTVAETAPFVREMVRRAREDCLRAFPEMASHERLQEWFDAEERRLEALIKGCAGGRLVDLYRAWMEAWLEGQVVLGTTSAYFAAGAGRDALLDVFTREYDRCARLYNRAIRDTGEKLALLDINRGELPFFAVLRHQEHLVRVPASLDGERIRLGADVFPLAADRGLPVAGLAEAGVECLAGKALLLVIQARLGGGAAPLALPYRGSLYMPAADRLAELLAGANLLPARLHPIVRVRFRLFDRMKDLKTTVRLPEHLAAAFGRQELPARDIGENWADLAAEAAGRLERFRDRTGRRRWQEREFPEIHRAIAQLNRERRELAGGGASRERMNPLWERERRLQAGLLDRTLRQIARDVQVSEMDYWDSRGALMPWCIGLGGESFYESVLDRAEVYLEPVPEGSRHES